MWMGVNSGDCVFWTFNSRHIALARSWLVPARPAACSSSSSVIFMGHRYLTSGRLKQSNSDTHKREGQALQLALVYPKYRALQVLLLVEMVQFRCDLGEDHG